MAIVSHVAWEGEVSPRHVFIATPTYPGTVHHAYFYSMLYSLERLRKAGWAYDVYTLAHNCHVDDARNGILRDFLQTKCTDLVFIDADVNWRPEDLVRLLSHDQDLVAGVYPKRQVEADWPVHGLPDGDPAVNEQGLVEVTGAPTGFMRLRRSLVEKMVAANRHKQFIGQGDKDTDPPYTIVFERTFADGHRWSGDYAFCLAWRRMGGKVFVDPSLTLTHVGEFAFTGTMMDWWKKKTGFEVRDNARIVAHSLEKIKAGTFDDETFNDLYQAWGNRAAASPVLLRMCYELAKSVNGPVMETGTGLSSLVMAMANPERVIHSLESDPVWASKINLAARKHGIENLRVHFGELQEYEGGAWYDFKDLPQVHFDLVLCDGPWRVLGKRSKLFDLIPDRINGGVVLMDDADDPEQMKALMDWSRANGRSVKTAGENTRLFAISYKEKA